MSSLDALLRPLGRYTGAAARPSSLAASALAEPVVELEPRGIFERRRRAVELTRDLLDEHGFGYVAVEISSRSVRRAGSCHYRGRERRAYLIRLAEWLVDRADWPEVEDTIRHEVAHAIAGHAAGHGPEWKRAAVLVGARPVRCFGEEKRAARPPMKFAGTCKCTGKLFERTRLSERVRKNGRCPTCKAPIEWRENH